MAAAKSKIRLLRLAQAFLHETDESRGLTMPELIERLAEQGISAERKSIYRDIDALREAGMDIRKLETRPVQYALVTRLFSESELLLLVDAVQESRFLTKRQSDLLVSSIKSLGSTMQGSLLDKRLHVGGRIKSQNESVFYNVDILQRAMSLKRKVKFHYFKFNCKKRPVIQHQGEWYTETPVQLMYSDGFYYLVAYNDKHESLINFRVDRMRDISLTDQPCAKNELIATFDVNEYDQYVFGMYSGEPVVAVLRVEDSMMNAVIDRFGKDVEAFDLEDGSARVTVKVVDTPLFYGWVAQYAGKITIEQPSSLKKSFVRYLEDLVSAYRS